MESGRQVSELFVKASAAFSPCRTYRYILYRIWDETKPLYCALMLNPSKADEYANDPTVERQMRRAKLLGYGGLVVINLFAFRATDPREMLRHPEPVGQGNDAAIRAVAEEVTNRNGIIVCGWGNDGAHLERSAAVVKLLSNYDLYALKVNQGGAGEPKHPLYVGYDARPVLWRPKTATAGVEPIQTLDNCA